MLVHSLQDREGMVLNSKSTSVDIMRWDFSVMGAKAYVLQLAENVRRSNEQKNKNGEIVGMAPLGYENYITEKGKKFVRPKEPDATIIKKLFKMYSLGNTSAAELLHYANMMGLKSRFGAPVSMNTIHYMLENPFYTASAIPASPPPQGSRFLPEFHHSLYPAGTSRSG